MASSDVGDISDASAPKEPQAQTPGVWGSVSGALQRLVGRAGDEELSESELQMGLKLEKLKLKAPGGDSFNFLKCGVEVNARVWTMPREVFPEMQEMPKWLKHTNDLGLALSGGGIRATCESFGVLQALHRMGHLKQVRYVCSNSGSSWVTAPFAFLPDDYAVSDFFGHGPLGPKKLTLAQLDTMQDRSFLKVASEANPTMRAIEDIVKSQATWFRKPKLRGWNESVTHAYLKPFGLHSEASVMSPPKGTKGYDRAQAAVAGTDVTVYPLRDGAPYPIINASQMHWNNEDPGGVWYPLEFTPLYSGLPLSVSLSDGVVGGGVLESFGLGAVRPMDARQVIDEDQEVKVKPEYWCPLAYAAGTSSGAPYMGIADKTIVRALGGEVVPVWHPAGTAENKYNEQAIQADGGACDDIAVLGLLRRNVRKIISVLGINRPFTDENLVWEEWWTSLFGRTTRGISPTDPAVLNARAQVFAPEKLDELVDAARKLAEKGLAPIVEQELDVLPNARCGVKGGYKVKVLWVFAYLSDSFRTALPQETQELLKTPIPAWKTVAANPVATVLQTANIMLHADDIDSGFPFNTTYFGNFTPRLCQLLSENMAHNLSQFKALSRFCK